MQGTDNFDAFPAVRLRQRALPCPQTSPSLEELHRLSYTKAARGRARVESALPSSDEAEALFQLDADLFTPEAVEGMRECVSIRIIWHRLSERQFPAVRVHRLAAAARSKTA